MATLAHAYPDDIDVQTLAADALVNVTARALRDTRTGEPRRDLGWWRQSASSTLPCPRSAVDPLNDRGAIGPPLGPSVLRSL